MSRPIRLEFPNALYHVTSRGNAQQNIYLSDADRQQFLNVLEHVCQRYNWVVHAYCLMSNHYHLLIETPDKARGSGLAFCFKRTKQDRPLKPCVCIKYLRNKPINF